MALLVEGDVLIDNDYLPYYVNSHCSATLVSISQLNQTSTPPPVLAWE